MKQVQDHELSALLDGELSAERAKEIRGSVQNDPALREEYNALAALDAQLSAAGDDAAFFPEIAFPAPVFSEAHSLRWPIAVAGVFGLIAVRFLPKLVDLSLLGFGVQLAACAAIIAVVVRMAGETKLVAPPPYANGIWQ